MAEDERGKTTGVGFSSGEAGPRLPGGAVRQNIYEETVRATEGIQETTPPDKVGPLCPVGGVSIIRGASNTSPGVHVWTDASGRFGCGAVIPETEAWLQLQWPESYSPEHLALSGESIALKELLPVVLCVACAVWGEFWREKVVHVHYDNSRVVALVNSGYSKVPEIMHLLRSLFLFY